MCHDDRVLLARLHHILGGVVSLRHENSCGFCMTQYFNASSVTQYPRLPPIASHIVSSYHTEGEAHLKSHTPTLRGRFTWNPCARGTSLLARTRPSNLRFSTAARSTRRRVPPRKPDLRTTKRRGADSSLRSSSTGHVGVRHSPAGAAAAEVCQQLHRPPGAAAHALP